MATDFCIQFLAFSAKFLPETVNFFRDFARKFMEYSFRKYREQVGIDEANSSKGIITIDPISSCIFFLLYVVFREDPFCYLQHYSFDEHDESKLLPQETLELKLEEICYKMRISNHYYRIVMAILVSIYFNCLLDVALLKKHRNLNQHLVC